MNETANETETTAAPAPQPVILTKEDLQAMNLTDEEKRLLWWNSLTEKQRVNLYYEMALRSHRDLGYAEEVAAVQAAAMTRLYIELRNNGLSPWDALGKADRPFTPAEARYRDAARASKPAAPPPPPPPKRKFSWRWALIVLLGMFLFRVLIAALNRH